MRYHAQINESKVVISTVTYSADHGLTQCLRSRQAWLFVRALNKSRSASVSPGGRANGEETFVSAATQLTQQCNIDSNTHWQRSGFIHLEPNHCAANTSGFYYISSWALLVSWCMHCSRMSHFCIELLILVSFRPDSWVNHFWQCISHPTGEKD